MTARFREAEPVVDWILSNIGRDLRVALPLGLGKPVTLVNALVRRACAEPDISLRIFTALTLERPQPSNELEKRFLGPAMDRLFGAYPEIEYARLLHDGALPDNIEVTEFFFQAPNWRSVDAAQQNYVSANYTHALDVLLSREPNLVLQLLAQDHDRLSLSCNTDITADLLDLRTQGHTSFAFVGQVHPDLPFMSGPAVLDSAECSVLLDTRTSPFDLFSVVKRPVGLADHAVGLHVSRLIKDGGTLQIGIGQVGDAIANALILRNQGRVEDIWKACPFRTGSFDESGPFTTGLYGVTEMLVDGMLALFEQGIIRRKVDGVAIHAGFFLDSAQFYERLRALTTEQRDQIAMMPVSFTNALYGDEEAKRAARRNARFVNSAMMVTLLGAVVSDATEDGRVISGVGGQFNFVDQAFALKDARAVITVSATRQGPKGLQSNIRWSYGHVTVPRHLRDIVVTEYGIADLRGKSDAATIAALLEIADSRFQSELEAKAKAAGKLPKDYRLPDHARRNTPQSLREWLGPFADHGLVSFPTGTSFTQVEQRLLPALAKLKTAKSDRWALVRMAYDGMRAELRPDETEAMRRMSLDAPVTVKLRLVASALRGALIATRDPRA